MLRWGELECITDVTHHQAKHLISTSLCAVSALCLGLGSLSVCGAFVCACVYVCLRLTALVDILPGARYPSQSNQFFDCAELRPSSLFLVPWKYPWGPSMSGDNTCTHSNANHYDPNTPLMPSLVWLVPEAGLN